MDTRHIEPSFYLATVYGWLSIPPHCVSVKGWNPKRGGTTKLGLILRNFKNKLCYYYTIFSVELHSFGDVLSQFRSSVNIKCHKNNKTWDTNILYFC